MAFRSAGEILHWFGRVTAIALFAIWMMFAVGEGFPPLWRQPLLVQLMFAGWGLIFLGYLVGWWRPAIGGSIVVAGLIGQILVEWSKRGDLLGPWFFLFAAPGVIYLVAAWIKRPRRSAGGDGPLTARA